MADTITPPTVLNFNDDTDRAAWVDASGKCLEIDAIHDLARERLTRPC